MSYSDTFFSNLYNLYFNTRRNINFPFKQPGIKSVYLLVYAGSEFQKMKIYY